MYTRLAVLKLTKDIVEYKFVYDDILHCNTELFFLTLTLSVSICYCLPDMFITNSYL